MIKHTGVEANRLLDAVINILKLKNDAALSRALGVARPVVSRIRHGKLTVGHMMIARIHEATGLPVSDLRMLIENDGTANKKAIIGSYRANVGRDKELSFNFDIPSTNVNYFLDALLKLCHIKNDAALCKMIDVSAPVLSKIRSAKIPIGTSMLIRFHELTGFAIADLRSLLSHSAGEFCMKKLDNMPVIHIAPENASNTKNLSVSQKNADLERDEFCGRLRQCLTAAGVRADSPTIVARAFNSINPSMQVTVHAVRKWIMGEMTPTQEKIKALAGWLNVQSSWLRYGEGSEPREGQIKSSVLSTEEMRIMRAVKQLSQADVNLVLALINRLTKQGSSKDS